MTLLDELTGRNVIPAARGRFVMPMGEWEVGKDAALAERIAKRAENARRAKRMDEHGLTIPEIAEVMGLSRCYVAVLIRHG